MTLKEVPPKKVKKVIPITKPDPGGIQILEVIIEGLKDGSIKDAVIVYREGKEDHYQALTYSSSETLGWMLQKAITCMVVENGESEEE